MNSTDQEDAYVASLDSGSSGSSLGGYLSGLTSLFGTAVGGYNSLTAPDATKATKAANAQALKLAQINAASSSSKTKTYAIIGGVLLLIVGIFFLMRRK